MTEGEDHYRTFVDLNEWLKRYDPGDYLRSINPKQAAPDNPLNQRLQSEYLGLLRKLYSGYKTGLPKGAKDLNQARAMMVSELDEAAEALARARYLVVFDTPKGDKRFASVTKPPDPKK